MRKPPFQGTTDKATLRDPRTLHMERLDKGGYRAVTSEGVEVASFGGQGDAIFGVGAVRLTVKMRPEGDVLLLENPRTSQPLPFAVVDDELFWERTDT